MLRDGRPTIAMETYVRLMVLKQRYRWGYRTLVGEVSDSIHLRRFCRIALSERVPDESTVRKLTRRIGPETVNELTRVLIVKATREKRFRTRAVRIDSTVIEADVKYPTDSSLAAHGVRALAREGKKLAALVGERKRRVQDRSRAMGRTLRALTRTIRRRSGEAKSEVLKLTAKSGRAAQAVDRREQTTGGCSAQPGAGPGRAGEASRGGQARPARGPLREGRQPDQQRVAGEPIHDRLVSLSDPDARPIRKGKLGKPNEFGYVTQLAEVTENTRRGARGLILPAATAPGNPGENTLLPDDGQRSSSGSGSPHERSLLDGGFHTEPTRESLRALSDPSACSSPAANSQAPDAPNDVSQRYRTGSEGRMTGMSSVCSSSSTSRRGTRCRCVGRSRGG